jgi:hypothetical protein
MNRSLTLAAGGILGAILGLAAWFGIGYGIVALVSHYYPPGGGLGLPSDETATAILLVLIVWPAAGVVGATSGVAVAKRVLRKRLTNEEFPEE